MAAASVIKDPSSGTTDIMMKYMLYSLRIGKARAKTLTTAVTSSRIGRLAATTITAETKAASVNLRVSMSSTAVPTPIKRAIKQISTKAQTPNAASTAESICHRPEGGPPRLAKRANTGTENV